MGILEALVTEAGTDSDFTELDMEHGVGWDNILDLASQIETIQKQLAAYQSHLAQRLFDNDWRPTKIGDDVVIVTHPKPGRKVNDEDAFWNFVHDILVRGVADDPELSVEDALAVAVKRIGLLFNPSGIRIGAFKQSVEALGVDGETAVDSLYSTPQPDFSKPPKIGRVPVSKWKYPYREET